VRLTDLWARLDAHFGSAYAASFASDFVIRELGGRTIVEALRDGEDAKTVWRAVCDALELPPAKR
jgi:hypothetical protein